MIRRILASLLLSIFVFVSVPLFFVWGVYTTFADKDFYKGEFVDTVYEFMSTELPRIFPIEEGADLAPEDISELFKNIIKKEDLEIVIGNVVDQFSSVTVKEGKIHFAIPLDWLVAKRDIISAELSTFMFEKFPICENGQEPMNDEGQFRCVPPGLPRADFGREVDNVLFNSAFVDIPAEFAFDLDAPTDFEGNVAEFLSRTIDMVLLAGELFLLLILVLIALIIFKPFIRILKWETKTIFLSSFFITSIGVVLVFFPQIFEALYDKFDVGLTQDEVNLMVNMFDLLLGSVARNMLIISIPIAVVSLVGWITSAIIYGRRI